MKYATASAFSDALSANIARIVREQGLPHDRVRRAIAFDRILARLMAAHPAGWLLKGGVALDLRLPSDAVRRTIDLDISIIGAIAAEQLIDHACAIDLGDYFDVRVARRPASSLIAGSQIFRYGLELRLSDRPFDRVNVDVATSDPPLGEPESLAGHAYLAFAEIPPTRVRAIPVEQHLAEKLHAYLKSYGARENSRTKDLLDITIIVQAREFNSSAMRAAVTATFAARATAVPATLPEPPQGWEAAYRSISISVNAIDNVADAFSLARGFFAPLLTTSGSENATWDPTSRAWLEPET